MTHNSNLAVLIDGDNVSSRVVTGLMAEVATYGTASVRRIYGDWTSPSLKNWKACLLNHSILPVQQYAYTTGKNSTDGAMIIDAMDLLYTNRFSGFCIVSSDSDFIRLASRIREQGVRVYGFGERKTNKAFIVACDKFTYFDVLQTESEDHNLELAAPLLPIRTSIAPNVIPIRTASPKTPLSPAALAGLRKAIASSVNYDDNYANLAEVGNYLVKLSPDFNARNFGYERLKDLVEASGIVELKSKPMGDKPPIALVRLK